MKILKKILKKIIGILLYPVALVDSEILEAADDHLDSMREEKHVLLYKSNLEDDLVKLCRGDLGEKEG